MRGKKTTARTEADNGDIVDLIVATSTAATPEKASPAKKHHK